MQGKTLEPQDNKGRCYLRHIYNDSIEEIEEKLKGISNLKKRTVSYRDFSRIIRCYFREIFEILLKGYSYDLFNKFGRLRIVKTKTNRYKPNYYIKDKSKIDDSFTKNYWHFLFWDCGKKWRMYEFTMSSSYKKIMMRKVNMGFEYEDYTDLKKDEYIRKVK